MLVSNFFRAELDYFSLSFFYWLFVLPLLIYIENNNLCVVTHSLSGTEFSLASTFPLQVIENIKNNLVRIAGWKVQMLVLNWLSSVTCTVWCQAVQTCCGSDKGTILLFTTQRSVKRILKLVSQWKLPIKDCFMERVGAVWAGLIPKYMGRKNVHFTLVKLGKMIPFDLRVP